MNLKSVFVTYIKSYPVFCQKINVKVQSNENLEPTYLTMHSKSVAWHQLQWEINITCPRVRYYSNLLYDDLSLNCKSSRYIRSCCFFQSNVSHYSKIVECCKNVEKFSHLPENVSLACLRKKNREIIFVCFGIPLMVSF